MSAEDTAPRLERTQQDLGSVTLTISHFRHCFDTEPPIKHASVTWERLCARLGPERPPIHRGPKEQIPLWSPADFGDGAKLAASVRAVCALVLDVDDGTSPLKGWGLLDEYERLLHTSYSHDRVKPGQGVKDRWRLVVPYAVPCPASEHARVWRWAAETARDMGITVDASCKNRDRWFCLPAVQDDAQPWLVRTTGAWPMPLFDWRTVVPAEPEVPRREPTRAVSAVAHTADHRADLAWFAKALANTATIATRPTGKRLGLLGAGRNLAGCLWLLPEVSQGEIEAKLHEEAARCALVNPSSERQYHQAVDDGIARGLLEPHPRVPRRDRPMTVSAMPSEGPWGYADDPGYGSAP